MNARYRITGLESTGYANTVVVMLRLERELEQTVAVRSMDEQIDEAFKAHKGTKVSEDDLRIAKSIFKAMMIPMAAQDPPRFTLTCTVALTEDEYAEMGRPTYGDWLELELRPGAPAGVRVLSGPVKIQKVKTERPRTKVPWIEVNEWLESYVDPTTPYTREMLVGMLISRGCSKEEGERTVDQLVIDGALWETRPSVYRRTRA